MSENHRMIAGFELRAQLGVGGDGSVYLARQVSLGRDVAVKLLSHGSLRDATDVERFRHEAQIAARLKHPGIVQVYEFGEDNGEYFIAMEYVAGENMLDRIHRKGHMAEKSVIALATSVAAALQYAWEKSNLIHCDIKPDNILVDEDGTVKVVDLGIAMMLGLDEVDAGSESFRCTPHYVAPEVVRGSPTPDARADIYSLGATMYHMLTGTLPFDGYPDAEVVRHQLSGILPDPQSVQPEVSTAMCIVLRRMLARNPNDRYADWQQLLDDLQRVDNGQLPRNLLGAEYDSTLPFKDFPAPSRAPAVEPPAPKRKVVVPHASRPSDASAPIPRRPSSSSHGGLIFVLLLIAIGGGYFVKMDLDKKKKLQNQDIVKSEDDEARNAFEKAAQFEAANREDFDASLNNYKNVAERWRGTEWEEKAKKSMRDLRNRLRLRCRAQLDRMKDEALPLIAANKYEEAIAIFELYSGPFAADMSEMLREEVGHIKKMQEEAEGKKPHPPSTTNRVTQVTPTLPPGLPNPSPTLPENTAHNIDLSAFPDAVAEQIRSLLHAKESAGDLQGELRSNVMTTYVALLEKGAESLRAQGNLDGMLAFQREKGRAEQEGVLPSPEELQGPEVLRDLARKAVSADYKILESHQNRMQQLFEEVKAGLASTVQELTRSGEIDAAIKLRRKLRELEQEIIGLQ